MTILTIFSGLWQVMDESISEEFQTVDLLCFSSQFYFLIGLLSFAMVLICLAIEGFLRIGYNPLGDQAFLILYIAIYIVGYTQQNEISSNFMSVELFTQ